MHRISNCAARLSAALHVRGMKQVELCNKTGISKSSMSQYIKGNFEPKQDRVEAISRALNVNEAWLMGYDGVSMERDELLPDGFRPGDLHSPSAAYEVSAKPYGSNEFERFLQEFVIETRGLSPESRNKLLELARFYKTQEEGK